MTAVNQSQFAALQGVSVGYVTKLKQQGRLVLTREGKVDVEASVRRIRETEDPSRDAVRAHHRAQRATPADSRMTADNLVPANDGLSDAAELMTYQVARAMKERFLALQAKTDYERSVGELVPASDVRLAGLNLGTLLRTHLEGLPDRLVPELAAAPGTEAMRALLVEQIEDVLREIAEGVAKL